MGLVTFAIFNIAISLGTKVEDRSSLSMDVLADRSFVIGSIVSILITIAMTELGALQRFLGTVPLNSEQWLVCIAIGVSLLLVAEIRKVVWKIPVDEVPKDDAAQSVTKPAA